MPNCILMLVENIRLKRSKFPLPNSNVMNRLIAAEREPEITVNMATTPPTTL